MNDDKQYIQIISQLATIQANQENFKISQAASLGQINEHLRQLNGKVVSHEDKLTLFQIAEKEMMSAIIRLSDEQKSQKEERNNEQKTQIEERNKVKWMFIERLFYFLLLLAYLVLKATGIINF